LAFANLASVEKRLEQVKKDRKADSKEGVALKKLMEVLYMDEPARNAILDEEEALRK
jgi:hypothetical protein